MRCLLAILALLFGTLTNGQGFNNRYDAFNWGYAQTAFGIESLADGYMVISGSSDYDSIAPGEWFFHASVLFSRIDLFGNKLWEKRTWRPMHGALPGWANCCDTIPGGGGYIVGGASEDTTGLDEVYLMRFNAEGDTLWTRVFGGPTDNYYWLGRQVKRTLDGGFLIVGDTGYGDLNFSGIDGFAIKTDSNGNEEWRQLYGEAPPDWRAFLSCSLVADSGYYMAGSFYATEDNGEHWVVRTDAMGDEIWNVSWGGPYSEGATQVITAADSHAIVFSSRGYALNHTASRPYIAKLNIQDGERLWEREYGPASPITVLFAGKECSNGDLIGAGGTYISQGPNNEMGLLLRTNSEGDSLWMFTYYYQDSVINNGQGRFYDVLPTADGGFIAAGVTRNPVGGPYPPGYSQDTWVVKVDALGCIIPGCNPVGITEQATNLLCALRIWPNPVAQGGQVQIELDLPPSIEVRDLDLSVVAMDGKVVHRQKILNSSTSQPLQLHQLSPGLYHLHITNGSTWLTGGKLVVE